MKVICINDKNKPNEIPNSRWIKKGEKYTIIKLMVMKMQGDIAGVKIAEINNDDLFPYTYFRLDRFGISEEELEKLVKQEQLEVEEV